ncbi:sel1 repeat family protein [Campylobacter geochelonis]|uniref:beta-lactamase n=1 Tax=Campylobacter geochelonis TaxID=1780362 RepID=A0A128EF99_9BACT|nr:sel1 repeat family protein [Campylobacter geochelonis]QKF71888.1 hypothetical protein CGEO_1611 [Campylobacter geochelonis]CZE47092.1 beta-lactamase HcpA [Campylobacter geochelonis]CZE47334.1 beta-lactamase HcpA [Campylobacter geochelonis]CZE50994.1 beta-lactamase HcpA [Campylobacter geochelonis]
MKKITKILVFSIPIFFLGCTAQNQGVKPSATTQSGKQDSQIVQKATTNLAQICDGLSIADCAYKGDKFYNQGDFRSAIYAYDTNCARQDVNSCLKMAKMFEKGEGVSVSKAAALDIYERACYSGNTPSCKDMQRLQK